MLAWDLSFELALYCAKLVAVHFHATCRPNGSTSTDVWKMERNLVLQTSHFIQPFIQRLAVSRVGDRPRVS